MKALSKEEIQELKNKAKKYAENGREYLEKIEIMKTEKKIKIFRNKAFIDLCKFFSMPINKMNDKIINAMIAEEVIEDWNDIEFCGETLPEIYSNSGISLTGYKNIYLWGINSDCPKCGCNIIFKETDHNDKGITDIMECENCGYETEKQSDYEAFEEPITLTKTK